MKVKHTLQRARQIQSDLDLREKELPGQERALTRAQEALAKGPPGGLDPTEDLLWKQKLKDGVSRAERRLAAQKALIERLKNGDDAPVTREVYKNTTSKLIHRAEG